MMTLGAGMVIFVGLHLIPTLPRLRGALIDKLGFNPYRGLFSLAVGLGLGLIIWGKLQASWQPLYEAPAWGRLVALWLMPLSTTLMVAAYLPTRLRSALRHPMLWSVTIWAGCHLLANGDLASVLLFAGMAVFALLDLVSHRWRSPVSRPRGSLWADAGAVLLGLIGYMGAIHVHAMLGRPVWYGALGSLP